MKASSLFDGILATYSTSATWTFTLVNHCPITGFISLNYFVLVQVESCLLLHTVTFKARD